jgi:hypothetical protein
MMAKIETDREEMMARMDANQAKMDVNIKEMRSILSAWIANMRDDRKEKMSCQVTTAACLESKESNPEGISGGPYGRGRSEIFWNNEEEVQGPESSCRATRRAEGTDPRRLWIPEEVGCRLQEGVPSCSSDTTQEKRLQENSDAGKLWTAKGIGRSRSRRMIHTIKVARRRGHERKRYDQDSVAKETQKGRTFGKRRWKGQECKNGIRDRGLKQQLRGSKQIKDLGGRRPLCAECRVLIREVNAVCLF